MTLWKKQKTISTYDEIFEALQNQSIEINELDPENPVHKKAVFNYVRLIPSLIEELHTETEKAFINYILERDYTYFIYLNPAQYEEYLVKYYLERRLADDTDATDSFLSKSFDESLVFSIHYDTKDGEQIFYYDNDLNTTTFLISKFEISFKAKSLIKLLKKLDVSVSSIGFNVLYNELMAWTNKYFRKTIIEYVTNKDIGVYKINSLYDEIEKDTTTAINQALADAGLVVQKMSIQKISISENASRILEKEGLDIIRTKIRKAAELEYEKQALENYEKKAKIHNSNPAFEPTLTEAEKDFALNRYITKSLADAGQLQETEYKDELSDRRKKTRTSEIQKHRDAIIHKKQPQGVSALTIILYILTFISLIVGIVAISNGAVGGIISLIVCVILFCIIRVTDKNHTKIDRIEKQDEIYAEDNYEQEQEFDDNQE